MGAAVFREEWNSMRLFRSHQVHERFIPGQDGHKKERQRELNTLKKSDNFEAPSASLD